MSSKLKLSSQRCFPIYLLSKEIVNIYRPILEEFDLTYPQYLVLMVLWEKQPQSVSQLGDELHLDSGTLTPLLKRLEQKEIIKRQRAVSDERIVEISLTEKGMELREKAEVIPQRITEKINITQEEAETLRKIINKIIKK